jgi:hypothetical protein
MKLVKLFLLFFLISIANFSFAANFNIVPTPGSIIPISVPPNDTVSAFYTIMNQTSKTLNGYVIQGLPNTVTQNTSSMNCASIINLASNASCVLQLDINGDANTNFALCKGISCTAAGVSLHVSTNYRNTFAYVSDNTQTLWQCLLNGSGGFNKSNCSALTNTTTPGFNQNLFTTFQNFSGVTYAYVTDNSVHIWKCPINSAGGFSGGCTALNNTPAFSNTSVITFKNFSGVTYAYVADTSNKLWQCPMNAAGNFNGNCTALTNSPAFNRTGAVTFATFSGVNFAYVTDISNTIWKCPLNATGGFSGVCTALTNNPAFNQTALIEFNTFSATVYGYVTDSSTMVWQCPMTVAGNFNGACTAMTNSPAFNSANDIAFFNFSGTPYAYIGDASNNIWQCPLNTSTGRFNGVCAPLSGFNQTIGTSFFTA